MVYYMKENNKEHSIETNSSPSGEVGRGAITFNTEGSASMPDIDQDRIRQWVAAVAATYEKRVGTINYIFVDDERILEVNRQFLGHDYYTDIITFDYTQGRILSGDLYISLDTVRTNAEGIGVAYGQELLRVVIHGVLHLCGINDKGPGEREIMEAAENRALEILSQL